MSTEQPQPYRTAADRFDRKYGALTGMPDVTKTEARVVRVTTPIVGDVETFNVQTLRQREAGDHIFIEFQAAGEFLRLYLPPAVSDAINRQRDALTARVRRRVGKESAAARKARGELPAFLKGRKAKRKKKAKAAE